MTDFVVEGLSVHYGGVCAVNGIGLTVPAGESIGLIGANGAGKSSALKALMGLVPRRVSVLRFGERDLSRVKARDMVVETEHPTLGTVKTLGSPIKMSATPPDVSRRAPQLGEHTNEVLREAGFSSDEIAALRKSGAAR